MPLKPAPLPIQFSGGVDLTTDTKQVPTTRLLNLENCVFTKLTTLSKRNGYIALSTQLQDAGGDVSDARGLGVRDNELLCFTDKRCFSQRPSADRWADTGEIAATSATTLPIARTGTYQTQPCVAERNGIRVAAWEDSRGGVWCSVIESATGRILRSQTQLDSAAAALQPRCVAVGDVVHVLWTRSDLGTIRIVVINPVSPATTPVVNTLTADLNASTPFFDACSSIAAPNGIIAIRPGLIAWSVTGGIRVGYLSAAGVLGSGLTGLPSVAALSDPLDVVTGPIAVAPNAVDGVIAVGWIGGASAVRIRILNAATLANVAFFAPLATTTMTRIALEWGATGSDGTVTLWWAAEVTAARSDLTLIQSGSIQVGSATVSAPTSLRGHGLVSRAWHDGGPGFPVGSTQEGDVYVLVAHTVRFFPYVAALRLSGPSITSPSAVIVSRLMPGECSGSLMRTTGAGTRAWTQHLPGVMDLDLGDEDIYSREHAVCVPYRIQLSSENGDQFSEQGLKLASLNFLPAYQTAQLGRGLYLASSAPMHYDGDAWHEADFHTAPDLGFNTSGAPVDISTVVSIVSAGAGNVINGTYQYAYWYEAMDAQGELHRGPTSVRFIVTMSGGSSTFRHAIPTCKLTRFSQVRICVARSEQGATGTDSTIALFKVTSNDVTITTGANRFVVNDPTVDTVTFDDNLSDASLTQREPLYTNGGILSNAPAPWSGAVLAQAKGRLFWTDTTDPNLVRHSQEIAEDTALEAPVDLVVPVDPFGGPITAIGAMDDGVYPMKETAVFVFGGPGPLRDPLAVTTNNGFTVADLVTSDVGCSSAMSVSQTPAGILFKSRKGIYLLNRARQAIYIGEQVDALNSQTVVRCTLLPDRQSIILLTDTPGGFSLLWDYARNQWSKFTNHVGLDAAVVDGVYHYLRPDSRVFRETPGVYRDDNTQIRMTIETAWIHFALYLQGWQRVLRAYFLGKFLSPHTLMLRYRLDYNEPYSPEIPLDVNTNWDPSSYGEGPYGVGEWGGDGGHGTRYQRSIHLNRRCQAISFRIQDLENVADFGASFELSELLLIGGGVGPAFKPGAARGGRP